MNDLVLWAYGATSALRLLSYLPQIVRVARDSTGAQAISCLTWNLWVLTNLTTAAYAWTRLGDVPLTVVHLGNAACCLTVVVLTVHKRRQRR